MRGGKRARSKLNSSAEYQLLCPYTNKTWAIDLLIPRTLRTVTTGTGTQHNGHGMLSLSDDHGFEYRRTLKHSSLDKIFPDHL